MRFDLTVTDETDRETLLHLLACEEHNAELIDRLQRLMEIALRAVPPCHVSMDVDDAGTTMDHDG